MNEITTDQQTEEVAQLNPDLQETARFQASLNNPPASARRDLPPHNAAPLKKSIFENGLDFGGTEQTYSASTVVDETTFFFVELPKSESSHVMTETRAIHQQGKCIAAMRDDDEGKVEASEALAQRSLVLTEFVIEKSLKDWSNPDWPQPVPCTPENRRMLTRSIKAALSDEILSRSFSGRSVESFLGK